MFFFERLCRLAPPNKRFKAFLRVVHLVRVTGWVLFLPVGYILLRDAHAKPVWYGVLTACALLYPYLATLAILKPPTPWNALIVANAIEGALYMLLAEVVAFNPLAVIVVLSVGLYAATATAGPKSTAISLATMALTAWGLEGRLRSMPTVELSTLGTVSLGVFLVTWVNTNGFQMIRLFNLINATRQRVIEQNQEIKIINDELNQSARLKDEFLANMSHELRTPLNAVLGLTEALQEGVYGSLTPQQNASLTTIDKSTQHLLGIINDLLDLAKIGAGRLTLNFEKLTVATLCNDALHIARPQAESKGQTLHLADDGETEIMIGDIKRLRQILLNLLSNAIKFTPVEGELGLEVKRSTDETLTFTVWDTGPGISPEDQDLLFRPFVQLDGGLSRSHQGTGLGLNMVARFAHLHGGTVSIDSAEGQGSRFTVTLPLNPIQPQV